MDWLLAFLRIIHVLLGTIWVGMMTFTVVFLMPAMRDVGPPGGVVMAALQRRKILVVVPLLALGTIISGWWLLERLWGGMGALAASGAGRMFAAGGLLAIVGFVIGIAVLRPAMARAAALVQSLSTAQNEEERSTKGAEIARLRARALVSGRLTLGFLVLATIAMAVARYLPAGVAAVTFAS